MPIARDVATASYGDMTNYVDDITIDNQSTDAAGEQKETTWINTKWPEYLGIYKSIPEVKTAIDMRAIWTVGKGYTTKDARTQIILDSMKGFGRDSFNTILKNMIVTRRICGDSFAEIMWNKERTHPINIKPLDPGSIKIVANDKGVIKRYEQITKTGEKKNVIKFEPRDIFHLVNKRVADEIHGVSDIEALAEIVKASNESFEIQKQVIKHFAKPKYMVGMDTDNQTKIDAFIPKFDEATNKGENIFFPKGTVDPQVLAVPPNSTINILPWRESLKNYFFQVVGIPQIILGSSGEFTESTAKIAYLAFQQSVEDEQLDIETQVWNQLYLRIELSFPATMQNELISDQAKDKAQGTEIQPQDMATGGVPNA